MTGFSSLSALACSLCTLWALLLCLSGIFAVILTLAQKQWRCAPLSLLCLACSAFLWQVCCDLSLFPGTGSAALSRRLGRLPWSVFLAALLLLTLLSLLLLRRSRRYGAQRVTPAAIKLCLDEMPCGVCCWRENGRVLFSNICMDRLCRRMTGSPLLNGRLFSDAVGAREIVPVGDSVWRFTRRDVLLSGAPLHELLASDITTEYARTQALERDRAALTRLKRELQDYNLSIDDTVRRQEILQAKVRIHDEMNRLMLSTMAAEDADKATLDRIFSLWAQNALLLGVAPDTGASERIDALAEALGIRLDWQGVLPDALTDAQRELLCSAAQEAIANAAKHGSAKTMALSFTESADAVLCRFTNDGLRPTGPVRFLGGLANLDLLAKQQGAAVSVSVGEHFTLCLQFPKKAEHNQPVGGCAPTQTSLQ
ncbi:MAG: hypothetical protein K6G54_04005 [Oscillospiraceae bacterium]|nr:hypothetical protein [Oscillospiraceae bacterium]